MFYEIPDATERHYTLHYYLFLVGWDKQPPSSEGVPFNRAEQLRDLAVTTALTWIKRNRGPGILIDWPKGE